MRRHFVSGVCAGLLIGLGGAVFLACDVKYAGAALFAVGLLSICYLGFSLFTGRVGFIVVSHKREDFSELLLCLAGNLVGASLSGLAVGLAQPARAEKALIMCAAKLDMPLSSAFICAFFCGVLMYLAVAVYKEKQSPLGIIFCVPVFILAGFEHSVADMFYFAAAGVVSLEAFAFIWVVIAGNALGGMFLPAMRLLMEGEKQWAK